MPTFYIEGPGNTYLSSNVGNPQGIVWDETTQTGGGSAIVYDDGISLTFIQVPEAVTILAGGGTDSYAFVDWPGSLAAGAVTVDLIFYSGTFTEITRFTAIGGGLGNVTPYVTSDVLVPAGGLIRLVMTNTDPVTKSIYGEMSLDWEPFVKPWTVGRVAWGDRTGSGWH